MKDSQKKKPDKFHPRIVVFACNWCSYAGADLAGIYRLQMPCDFRIVRVMCSARVRPEFIVYALSKGADGVLVLGCHPGECHYTEGNYYTRRRVLLLREFLEYMGVEPERFQLRWVSASEALKFADVIKETVEKIKQIGPMGK